MPKQQSVLLENIARRARRNSLGRALGQLWYQLGFYAECKLVQVWRVLRAAGVFIAQLAVWLFGGTLRAVKTLLNGIVRDIREPFRRAQAPTKAAARARDAASAYKVPGGSPAKAYFMLLLGIGKLLFPLAAALVFGFTVFQLLSLDYNLAVYVNSELVGYVQDEASFEDARTMLRQRIVAAEGRGQEDLQISLEYRLSSAMSLTTKTQLVNNILLTYDADDSDALVPATGFEIDGTLYVSSDGERVAVFLQNMLDEAQEALAGDVYVQFAKTVEYDLDSDAIFFSSSVRSYEQIVELFTSIEHEQQLYTASGAENISEIAHNHELSVNELLAYNPELQTDTDEEKEDILEGAYIPEAGTQLVVSPEQPFLPIVENYLVYEDEIIPYRVVEEETDSLVSGLRRVVQQGSDGLQSTPYIKQVLYGVVTLVPDSNREPIIHQQATDEVVNVGTYITPNAGEVTEYSEVYLWPVPDYNYMRRGYLGSAHRGLDINAPIGTYIYSSNAGTVIESGYNGTWGLTILIDHGDGVTTRYAHCDELFVEVGDEVGGNQVIATIGMTGRTSGPHCHFEVKVDGVYVDPQQYVTPPQALQDAG